MVSELNESRVITQMSWYIYNAILLPGRLKGTVTLMISVFYMQELSEASILIPVLSNSVEKYGSYGRLNICKWALMEEAIL